jgi:malate synthase
MAAQVPIKGQPEANERAFQKVRDDKIREAGDGHDGTWVAHPGLVPVALEVFNQLMPAPNQIEKQRDDVQVTAGDLLLAPQGKITEAGLRTNISVGIQYMASWLSGNGCVAINHLMEDAATAEISRAQVWQWLHMPDGVLEDGRKVDLTLFENTVKEEIDRIKSKIGDAAYAKGNYAEAATLFKEIILQNTFEEFLTLKAYDHLN